jgi:prolipoprotein diacylglyceryltransferase
MSFVGAIILMAGIGLALGAVVGRWPAVVVAGLAWPVFALGVWTGAWGNGFSKDDSGWVIAAMLALYTMAAIAGATIGVLARTRHRALRHPSATNT